MKRYVELAARVLRIDAVFALRRLVISLPLLCANRLAPSATLYVLSARPLLSRVIVRADLTITIRSTISFGSDECGGISWAIADTAVVQLPSAIEQTRQESGT